jgi:thymidylate synthase
MSNLNLQFIEARDLPDAWFLTLFKMLEEGRVHRIDRGSYAGQRRLEFDWVTIHVRHPDTRPLLPQIEAHHNIPNPVADNYLDDYISYLMTGELKPGESYTYGQRMCRYPLPPDFPDPTSSMLKQTPWSEIIIPEVEELIERKIIFFDEVFQKWCMNQIELLIWTYKNKGYRNNQMIIQVGHPSDMLLQDPPCLRHIDTRIQDGKLAVIPYFRSWDLWGGFPANLGGIQLLKEYISAEIGVEDGEIVASSKGLHLYDYSFDLAKCLRMRDDMKLKGE